MNRLQHYDWTQHAKEQDVVSLKPDGLEYIGGPAELLEALRADIARDNLQPIEPRHEPVPSPEPWPWIMAGLSWFVVGVIAAVCWWRS